MLVVSQLKFVIDIFGLLTHFNSLYWFNFDKETQLAQALPGKAEGKELMLVTKQNLVSDTLNCWFRTNIVYKMVLS